ncbi:MAG: tetratricopeptide repeat protein [Methylophilaceae bacterium]
MNLQAQLQKGLTAHQQGNLKEAESAYQAVLKKAPSNFDAHHLLGVLRGQQQQFSLSIVLLRRAIKINPRHAGAYANLGNAQLESGLFEDALASYDRSLNLTPNNPDTLFNRGIALKNLQRNDEALASYNRVLAITQTHTDALLNRGNVLQEMGQDQDALASYEAAFASQPNSVNAVVNYCQLQRKLGNFTAAIQAAKIALTIEDSLVTRSLFFDAAKGLHLDKDLGDSITPLLVRAMSEPWGPPHELAKTMIGLIWQDDTIAPCIARAIQSWPEKPSLEMLFSEEELLTVARHQPLRCLLENAASCDIGLEKFLTLTRHVLLQQAVSVDHMQASDPDVLNFHCALARQCFINEYIFYCDKTELQCANALKVKIESALIMTAPVSPLWIAAVASYFPLHALANAIKLCDTTWASPVQNLLQQQIEEPLQELSYADLVTRLTLVNDSVSQLVQQQYEENPYPRWVKYAAQRAKTPLANYLHEMFPRAGLNLTRDNTQIDYLVAGCGTGHQVIDVAQSFYASRIVAVDLSLKSLCYATRKTKELSITSIEYAQADIMELASTGWTFDVIESVGVLHHMADPLAGWRVLTSMLRPGGFMKLGFYSETARRNLNLRKEGISSTEDIRELRQALMLNATDKQYADIIAMRDFYGASECRDLLFHVREHRFNLIQIKEILAELGLTLCGFQLSAQYIKQYQVRFPEDASRNNLDFWNIFEQENPYTFIGMYQFWVQKTEFC